MLEKPAVTRPPIAELIARRWSPRAMDSTQPVSRDHLLALLEAARWAPSCFGDQPWRYLVWDRFRDPAGWQQAFECLAEGNQSWVQNAPVLLLAVAAPAFGHNGQPNRWAQYDTGAASENLCLQAAALGLVAHQMGGFNPELGQGPLRHSRRSCLYGDDRGRASGRGRRAAGRLCATRNRLHGSASRWTVWCLRAVGARIYSDPRSVLHRPWQAG